LGVTKRIRGMIIYLFLRKNHIIFVSVVYWEDDLNHERK